jgi:DNA-directed RNA polymerase subunit H (RpoH/RPB5)
MSGTLYRKYVNIQLFATEYRKFQVIEPFLTRKQFKKTIQLEQFVRAKCRNAETGRIVYIYLMKTESKFIKTTPNFKKLMDTIGTDPADIYIITKLPLSIYINKVLHEFSHLKIQNFLHRHFSIEATKGPLCSHHEILTDEEVIKTCFQDLMIHPLSIPPIFTSDTMSIWIGAEIGQVIKITANSENAGKVVRYRIVSPKVGRIPINKTPSITAKKVMDDDIIDDDIIDDDKDEDKDDDKDEDKEEEDNPDKTDDIELYDMDDDLPSDAESE